MINLVFGKVKGVSGARVEVELTGYEENGVIEAVLLQPCGQGASQTWMAPNAGDVVAVLLDDQHAENSVVLGGIYGDSQSPVVTDSEEVAIKGKTVYIGDIADNNVPYASRDDRVQHELEAIETALRALCNAFVLHQHAVSTTGTAAAQTGTATFTTTTISDRYTAGSTAADSVKIK